MGHLTVILGCMFAQKTTELVRMSRRYRSVGWKVLLVNHSIDTRYGTACIASHDLEKEPAVAVSHLKEVDEAVRSGEYQAVVIDEGQFFPDLFEHVTGWADQCAVNVVVAGLDGTFQREPFGDMLRLVPHAEEVVRLSALCARCGDGTKAIYSRRLVTEVVGATVGATEQIRVGAAENSHDGATEQIRVGAADSYEPVCRKHFLE